MPGEIPEHLVFISGPFRAETDWQRTENIRRAQRVGLVVAFLGAVPYIPHANTGFFYGELPEDFFLAACYTVLQRCTGLVTVHGWQHSVGAKAEVDFAVEKGLEIFHTDESLLIRDADRFLRWIDGAA